MTASPKLSRAASPIAGSRPPSQAGLHVRVPHLSGHGRSVSDASFLALRPMNAPVPPPGASADSGTDAATARNTPSPSSPSSPLSSAATFAASGLGSTSPRSLRAWAEASGKNVHIHVHNYFAAAKAAVLSKSSPHLDRHGLPAPASHASATAPTAWTTTLRTVRRLTSPDSTLGLVLMCMLWYASSALTNTVKKQILQVFPYPVTVTIAQFASVGILSVLGASLDWLALRRLDADVVRTTWYLGLFQLGGHVLTSLALSRAPVALVQTVKALSPLFTVVLCRVLFGMRSPLRVWGALVPLMAGVVLACAFRPKSADAPLQTSGLLLATLSTLIFVLQSIVCKKILGRSSSTTASASPRSKAHASLLPVALSAKEVAANAGNKHMHERRHSVAAPPIAAVAKLDKVNLLFYSSLFALLFMVPVWLTSDAWSLWTSAEGLAVDRHLVGLFVLNGASHFTQATIAFSLLSRVSNVTYSVVSLFKRVAIIVASILWLGEVVSGTQAIGVALAMVGLWLYQRASGKGAS
ncbi:suppressor of loss of ypt1 [Allomyces arbusculus]|nr:suppressor of loss of ypt1 [Allomyces arbusculus]